MIESSVWEHIAHILGIDERIVDPHEVDVVVLQAGAEDQTADTAKTVDTNINSHCKFLLKNFRSVLL